MRKLIAILALALAIPTMVFSGVGDVYYCTTDDIISYDQQRKKPTVSTQTIKFKFKWTKRYGADYLEFDDNFIIGNFSMSNVSVVTDDYFTATDRDKYFTDFLSFSDPRFQFVTFLSETSFNSITLYASCSKF